MSGIDKETVVPEITRDGDDVVVTATEYTWRCFDHGGRFEVVDTEGRRVVSGPLQPAVVVAGPGAPETAGSPGRLQRLEISGLDLRLTYHGVNGDGGLIVVWSFAHDHIVQHPLEYAGGGHVVSVVSFPEWDESGPVAGLSADFAVQPGSSESSAIGPVLPLNFTRPNMRSWLGRGGKDDPSIVPGQWGLPAHYFGGYSLRGNPVGRSALTKQLSSAFCCGLTSVPGGDFVMEYHGGRFSPFLRLHHDLWGQPATAGKPVTVGPPMLWAFADDYRRAIRSYYRILLREGYVRRLERSERKNAVMAMSQFNTWGAQMAEGSQIAGFSQTALERMYSDFRASGMDSAMFVIDDKWEGEYGLLEHDAIRFPKFEQFLEQVRTDGHAVGIWAAFLRCDDPATLGLTVDQMLCRPDGTPYRRTNISGDEYYLFDVSIPQVREALTERARRFVERYRPDLVKFDFGYELPSMRTSAPAERSWGGEAMLYRALELVIGAMRQVNPDLVVMYYNLSPLLLDYVDLHSMDDLWVNAGEYDLEVNRRIFFSSLLGELGVPSYGSGGYDWLSVKDIWFDTVASGPLGSLNSFRGDQQDSAPSAEDIARYRGLSRLSRNSHVFTVDAIGGRYHAGSDTARSRSWVRTENGVPVLVALRVTHDDGRVQPESYDTAVVTDTNVVVGSLTDAGLATAERLGVVPCGAGQVRIRRSAAGLPTVVAHTARGDLRWDEVKVDGSDVVVRLATHDAGGTPIDWIECRF